MPDPIVEATMNAISGMMGGRVQHRTENNHAPSGGRNVEVDPTSGFSVTTKAKGFLETDSQPEGSTLNPQAQLGLFTKIRRESDWLRFTSFAPVTENSGYLDQWDDRNFRMHPTAKNGPRKNIPLHSPDLDSTRFDTKTMSGAFGIRLKALRSASRAGQNVNALVQRGVAAGIGNVLADLGINGDASLPDDTDLNKQRRTVDGWFQTLRQTSPNYQGKADGFSYHNGLWAGMLQQIDKAYRSDPGLAWGMNDTLGTRWLTELTATAASPSNAHPSIVNNLGSQLLNAMGAQANPLGKTGIVIPQIDDEMFGSDESYAGIAPGTVTNNGDSTLTFNINTLAESGVDRSELGEDGQRYVIIGSTLTGVEERIAVDYSDPNNTVTTTTLLGSENPSASASDYYVKWSDTQSLFLGLYRFLILVVQNGMRIYTVFYPNDETIEIIVHADLDYLVADPEATSLVDDLISPQFNVFPS